MPVAKRLKELFDENEVAFELLEHPPAFTAQEEAAAAHVPGRNWAKTVVVLADEKPVQAVLSAVRRVDLEALARAAGATSVTLADEEELRRLYPDCEPGAMPPFGRLYGHTTFVDERLREGEYIVFHAGDHETAVKLPYSTFEELEQPVVASFSDG